MVQDRPLFGILLMLGFCLLAPLGDALAKIMGAVVPLFSVVFARYAVQVALLLPLALRQPANLRLSRRVLRIAWGRALAHVVALGAMFLSLQYLPLADAIAIAYIMPFLLLLFGSLFLGEQVGWRRILACILGFAGVLMVTQPAFADVGWPALLPLGVAVLFSLFMLATRVIAKETEPVALQAVNGAMGCALLLLTLPALWAMGAPVWPSVSMGAGQWAMLIGIGVFGTLAHLCITFSLRFAPGATVAPVQYLEIPAATVFGWMIFQDLPNGLAAWGIAVIMAAGLFIIWREQATLRQQAEPAPQP